MELMKTFEDDIKKYRDAEHIEIELRLGKITPSGFNTDVGPHVFGLVMRGLDAYNGWESTDVADAEVYYWGSGVRCVYTDEACTTERKNPIVKKNLKLDALDVRLGISQEIPVEMPTDEATRCVRRQRKSYLRKNVRIDLSMVTGAPVDKDSESVVTYQVELEILSAKTDQEIFSALYKVHDVLKLINP